LCTEEQCRQSERERALPAKTKRRSGEDDGMKTMEQHKEKNIRHACFLLFKLKILIFRLLIYIIQNFNRHVLHISGINWVTGEFNKLI
jgi:hypothetical protein